MPSEEISRCIACGAQLPPRTPAGLCPICGLRGSLEDSVNEPRPGMADGASERAAPQIIGDYQLLEEIARGGMGVVYKARQVSLDRIVAVKILLFGRRADADCIKRFRIEASSAAALTHKNIIPIHEVGVHEGEHYLAMEYVSGSNLASFVQGRALPPRRAARYLQLTAEAVHYAHERGILHRDIKPSNVIIDEHDEPRLTDFGLATRLAGETGTTLQMTATGHLLGSPSFVSPEQAIGARGKVGRHSDVYSLGAVLYHLLTGRPPFAGGSIADTLRQVETQEPVAPRLLDPSIPGDLEVICLKCLQKEPARRYRTALELAEELKRFLNHEPIVARPAGRTERVWRWCRRHPAVAMLTAATLALLLAIALGSSLALARINAERRRAENFAAQESQQRTKAESLLSRMEIERSDVLFTEGKSAAALDSLLRPVRRNPSHEAAAARLLSALSLRHFALPLPDPIPRVDRVNCARWSPDGQRLITATYDGAAQIWDLNQRAPLGPALRHPGRIRYAEFSPDGRRVVTASADKTAAIWDAATGRRLVSLLGHGAFVNCARFSPDGDRIVTASDDGTARIWNSVSGEPMGAPIDHGADVYSCFFTPDGRAVVTSSKDRTARVWHGETGLPLGIRVEQDEEEWPYSADISPDGSRVALGGGGGQAVVRRLPHGELEFDPIQHDEQVRVIQFSPEGLRFATASANLARIWDSRTGQALTEWIVHDSPVTSLQFSADGRRLLAGTMTGARLWDISGRPASGFTLQHWTGVRSLSFSADGGRLLTVADDTTGWIWDARTAQLASLLPHPVGAISGVVSPDGSLALTVARGNDAYLWDAKSGDLLRKLGPHQLRVRSVRFSPDGARAVTASLDDTAAIWNVADGRRIASLRHGHDVHFAEFSPNGELVATASTDSTARVWDARTGIEFSAPLRHEGTVLAARFDPAGDKVATVSMDGAAKIWRVRPNLGLLHVLQHGGEVVWAEFSPDGQRLATACSDRFARVWDVHSGRLAAEPLAHSAAVEAAHFSPDSSRVATASSDQTARVWDAMTGLPLSEPLRHEGRVIDAVFSPDGRHLATASTGEKARLWELPPRIPTTPGWLMEAASIWSWDGSSPAAGSPGIDRLAKVRAAVAAAPKDDPLTAWGEWLMADRLTRPRSPRSTVSFEDEIQALSDAGTVELLEQAIQLSPTNAVAAARLARALLARHGRDAAEAAWWLRWGAAQGPEGWEAWWARGELAAREGQFTAAEGWIRRALQSQPGDGRLWFRLGQFLERTQAWEESASAFSRAVELASGSMGEPAALRADARQERARIHRRFGRIEDARRDVDDALSDRGIPPRDPALPQRFIDLSGFYTQSLDQDLGRARHFFRCFVELPRGRQTLAGVDFDIRGIVLAAHAPLPNGGRFVRPRFDGISIGQRCQRLHFLHATGRLHPKAQDAGRICDYIIRYADGSTIAAAVSVPEDSANYWTPRYAEERAARATLAWSRLNVSEGGDNRLYLFTWVNPRPEAEIIALDMIAAGGDWAPFLIAITAE